MCRGKGTLLPALHIASAGGHLEELADTVPRLGPDEGSVWVTYDLPQARSMLRNESVVIHAHHPTTKNVPNAVRNYRLARRVFAEHEIDRVISTGAAVAVPFMLRATQLGIPCHYIESATRVDGPSLSGRMISRLRSVHLYRQMGTWGEPRWRQGPCVFDGYAAADSAESRPIEKVLVSLGTHDYPFDRLVARLAATLREQGDDVDVLWQLGSTTPPPGLPGRTVARLPHDELQAAIADADVVVGHAGVGLTLTALQAGTVPVLVPRRRARREHTDDHQAQLASELDRRSLAVVAELGELSREHLERAASLVATRDEPPAFELVD